MTNLITIGKPLPPSIIGFRIGNETLGVRDTLKHVAANITVKGLWKVGAATVIAAGATAIQEIQHSRGELQGRVEMLQRRNSDLTTALIAAQTKRKAVRWTDAERAFLAAEIAARDAKRPGYQAIAALMTEAFGRHFTAQSVGTQARRQKAAETVKPLAATVVADKAPKAAGKRRTRGK